MRGTVSAFVHSSPTMQLHGEGQRKKIEKLSASQK
jgi:hypothetical protein